MKFEVYLKLDLKGISNNLERNINQYAHDNKFIMNIDELNSSDWSAMANFHLSDYVYHSKEYAVHDKLVRNEFYVMLFKIKLEEPMIFNFINKMLRKILIERELSAYELLQKRLDNDLCIVGKKYLSKTLPPIQGSLYIL